jgi:hypothetical protein
LLSSITHIDTADLLENNLEVSLISDPMSYEEAMNGPNREEWKRATIEEWNAILENDTFEVFTDHRLKPNPNKGTTETENYTAIQVPFDTKIIGSKWVYRTKRNPDGTTRYKVRLVVKGWQQIQGVDYNETFAPVSKLTTLHLLLAMYSSYNWKVCHLDVVMAFLNPKINNDNIYMELPDGMDWVDERTLKGAKVYLLKSLYGLKQSPCLWYQAINAFLLSLGLKQSSTDPNLYVKDGVLLLLYVDNILIVNTSDDSPSSPANQVIMALKTKYKMSDLGEARHFLGLETNRDKNSISLSQETYINTMIKWFGMENSRNVSNPLDPDVRLENEECEDNPADRTLYLSLIGSLMYAALGSHPDISFAISSLSRYNLAPLATHLTAAKRVLRYLKSTSAFRLHFPTCSKGLEGFTDSDWAGCHSTRKSIGGSVFQINNSTISWKSKSQTVVALSTLEAEFIACSDGTREAVWLSRLEANMLNLPATNKVPMACDNQGAIKFIKLGIPTAKTKHIDVKHLHTHDKDKKGNVDFYYIESRNNVADIMTKPLPVELHQELTRKLGIY